MQDQYSILLALGRSNVTQSVCQINELQNITHLRRTTFRMKEIKLTTSTTGVMGLPL